MTREELSRITDIGELISVGRDYDLYCLEDVYTYYDAVEKIRDYAYDHIGDYGLDDFKNAIEEVDDCDSYYFHRHDCYFREITDHDFDHYYSLIYDEMEESDLFDEEEFTEEEIHYEDSPELEVSDDSDDSFAIKNLFGECCNKIKSIDEHIESGLKTFFDDFAINFTKHN